MKRIGIIGASGYTGFELIKLLDKRKGIELAALNSESSAGKKVSEIYPEYKGDLTFTNHSIDEINRHKPDLVFLCMGEGYAKDVVPKLKCKVIDLSRDFRLDSDVVYGLPELFRDKIRKAQVVSNPGCYATASILAAYLIVRVNLAERIVFDCKSGYSGAGRTPSYLNDPKNFTDNVIPYKITQHQHKLEIERHLTFISGVEWHMDIPNGSTLDETDGMPKQVKEAVDFLNKNDFEDVICAMTDEEIRDLLKRIEPTDLVLALKKASEELKNKIFMRMSTRAADNIKEEMQWAEKQINETKEAVTFKAPSIEFMKLWYIEVAQQKIVETAKLVKKEHAGITKTYSMPISFTPHVVSLFRGLMSTAHIFLNPKISNKGIKDLYAEFYKNEPFVKIVDKLPELHDVQNTNYCHIGGFEIDDTGQLVIISVIDNLLKGASGQAVQNMNLMLGFEETEGLL